MHRSSSWTRLHIFLNKCEFGLYKHVNSTTLVDLQQKNSRALTNLEFVCLSSKIYYFDQQLWALAPG